MKKLLTYAVVGGLAATGGYYLTLDDPNPPPAGQPGTWFNSDWDYAKQLWFNSSHIDSQLQDFPVCIKLDNDMDLYDNMTTNSSGDEIAFAGTGGTQLDHEIEYWNADGSGVDCVIWVEIPYLNSSTNTTIWMYYGDTGSNGNQEDVAGTWNSGFEAVYHFGDSGTNDSTGNNRDGTEEGAPTYGQTGIIGESTRFDGDDDAIEIPSNFSCFGGTGNDFVIEWWFNSDAWAPYGTSGGDNLNTFITFNDENQVDAAYKHKNTDRMMFVHYDRAGWKYTNDGIGSDYATGTWYYAAWRYDNSWGSYSYLNGTQSDSVAGAGSIDTNTKWSGIGANGDPRTSFYDGFFDEIRISSTDRSVDWLETTFDSIYLASDGEFFDIGPQLDQPSSSNDDPVISAPSPTNGTSNVPVERSYVKVTITDTEKDNINWTIETNPDIGSQYNWTSADSEAGTNFSCDISGCQYNTTYTWWVNATDESPASANSSNNWSTEWYTFTIEDGYTFSNPNPANGSTEVSVLIDIWNVTIDETNNYLFNWTIVTSPDIGSNSSNLDSDGSIDTTLSSLAGNTQYTVWANVTNATYGSEKHWYTFTTETPTAYSWENIPFGGTAELGYINNPPEISPDNNETPANGITGVALQPTLSVYIEDDDGNSTNWWIWTKEDGGSYTFRESGVGNNVTATYSFTQADTILTKYWWKVAANDGHDNVSVEFNFTTAVDFQTQAAESPAQYDGYYDNYTIVSNTAWLNFTINPISYKQEIADREYETNYTTESNVSAASPFEVSMDFGDQLTNVTLFRFYYYNASGKGPLSHCPAVYSFYNDTTHLATYNVSAAENGQWITVDIPDRNVYKLVWKINATQGGETKCSVNEIELFGTKEDVPTERPTIDYFEDIPTWWNDLDWAVSLHVDDVSDMDDSMGNDGVNHTNWVDIMPLTVMCDGTTDLPDWFVAEKHVEYGSHFGAVLQNFHYANAYTTLRAARNTSQNGTVRNSLWSDICISHAYKSSKVTGQGAHAAWDAGLRIAGQGSGKSGQYQQSNSWRCFDNGSMTADVVRQLRGLIDLVWSGRQGGKPDEGYTESQIVHGKENGTFVDLLIHPNEWADFDQNFRFYIENDTTGWHATWGEVTSYWYLRNYTNVTVNSSATTDEVKAFDVKLERWDKFIWDVPMTFKFNLTGFDWNGTIAVHWSQNNTLYLNSFNNISTHTVTSGEQHTNQTMREGYKWDGTELSVSTRGTKSNITIYLFANATPTYQTTVRGNGVDYFVWMGENKTAIQTATHLQDNCGVTWASGDYIAFWNSTGTWDDSTWHRDGAWYSYHPHNGTGTNFIIHTFDVIKLNVSEAGDVNITMEENANIDYSNSRSISLTNTTDNRGGDYTGYTNSTVTTLINITTDIGLDSGEYISLWNETNFNWDIYIVGFWGTDAKVHQCDVVVTKVEDAETWNFGGI